MEPTPSAIMAQTFPISESSPKMGNNGKINEEVVMMATVEEPCADFNKAAIKKGIKIPKLSIEAMDSAYVFRGIV